MTRILEQILPDHEEIKTLHVTLEMKPFIRRYIINSPGPLTLEDHYRYLYQFKKIYDTFTELLTSEAFTPKLPDNLSGLLQRGANIQKDLNFLNGHVNAPNKDQLLVSTSQYIICLKQIPLNKGDDKNNQLLIHFLISILADLNGGQFLKNIIKKLYTKDQIYQKENSDNGVQFYIFDACTGDNLTKWLKSFIESNDGHFKIMPNDKNLNLKKGAIDAFKMQATIIDELETTRQSQMPHNHLTSRFSFFKSINLKRAATVTTLAAGAAVAMGIVNKFTS